MRVIKSTIMNDMGWVCSTYEGEERWVQDFGGEAIREKSRRRCEDKNMSLGSGMRLKWRRIGTGDCVGCGNEPPGSIKC